MGLRRGERVEEEREAKAGSIYPANVSEMSSIIASSPGDPAPNSNHMICVFYSIRTTRTMIAHYKSAPISNGLQSCQQIVSVSIFQQFYIELQGPQLPLPILLPFL